MELHTKLWIENDGGIVLSAYRVRLLRIIDEQGSISRAAAEMGLSYRRAWGKVREIEQNLGVKLVARTPGGRGGGSSKLTPDGHRLVDRYERFQAVIERHLASEFQTLFGRSPDAGPPASTPVVIHA